MALNIIWLSFFVVAFITGIVRLVYWGDVQVFPAMVQATFDKAKTGFEIALYLTGALSLWLGIMKIGEHGGAVALLSRLVRPLFKNLFPEVPPNHPVYGSMVMNFAANMLGLDNAATPAGLKAMRQLQEINPTPEKASNAQIMFLVLNTSGLTLLPISVMAYRAQQGAVDPADVFLPILLATFFSTMVGLLSVCLMQKINILQKGILLPIGGLSVFVFGLLHFISNMPQDQLQMYSSVFANVLLFSIIVGFIGLATIKKVNVYESFIEGAKEGFMVAVGIIPYLVAILVAIAVFRASGAMDFILQSVREICVIMGFDTRFVDALPTAIMKPLSGSGARGAMVETMQNFGADSFAGRLASTFQGATDTTFYIIAVYFGSVGIKNTRHAVPAGLLADAAGIIAAIFVAYLFFG
jgi:spore maturation protein SpmA